MMTATPRALRPPDPLPDPGAGPVVFLAGSIAMGAAEPWQDEVEARLQGCPVTLLNPRRADWDASWEQSIDHPEFRAQVEWELAGLERATLVLMYFAPDTRAPITLLELGLHARSNKLVVCCPPGFWRRGNVEVVCAAHGVPMVPDLDALIAAARTTLPASRATGHAPA